MNLILKIAAGIILAGTIMALGRFAVTAYVAHQVLQEAENTIAEQRARQAAQQRQVQAARQAESTRRLQEEQRQQQVRQQQLVRQRANNELDRAFEDQYVPLPSCVNPQSETRWVECVDLRKQARREFRAQRLNPQMDHKDIAISG